MKDLYELLEIERDADVITIKRAYRKMSMKHHPDRESGDVEAFKKIQLAYEVLKDPERRKVYDETGTTDAKISEQDEIEMLVSSTISRIMAGLEYLPADYPNDLRINLKREIKTGEEHLAKTKTLLSRVQRLSGQFKGKLFQSHIESKEAFYIRQQEQIEDQLKLFRGAFDFVKDYEFIQTEENIKALKHDANYT